VQMGDTHKVIQNYFLDDNFDNIYKSKKDYLDKQAYTKTVKTLNEKNEIASSIKHDERFKLEIEFYINQYSDRLNLGLALLDKYKRRVFTINIQFTDLLISKSGNHKVIMSFPANVIAPNSYSWLLGINNDGKMPMIDQIDDCCSFTIIDNGSDFASQEGYDYGNIFMNDFKIESSLTQEKHHVEKISS